MHEILQDLRSLIDHLDRLGRDCVGQPGSGAIALWQVGALELRDRVQALGALRPGAPEALRRLLAAERAVEGLAAEVRVALAADEPPAVEVAGLLPPLSALVGKLRALHALHARLTHDDETCGGPGRGSE
ncbi:MAG TPA: hypothetical protein PK668_07765 [Myxococcota bacterium]|nr:hypothetical protein [Myxococcota bacterium]HRY93130.1 hypothetical protein [Myxococcota bacterium]